MTGLDPEYPDRDRPLIDDDEAWNSGGVAAVVLAIVVIAAILAVGAWLDRSPNAIPSSVNILRGDR